MGTRSRAKWDRRLAEKLAQLADQMKETSANSGRLTPSAVVITVAATALTIASLFLSDSPLVYCLLAIASLCFIFLAIREPKSTKTRLLTSLFIVAISGTLAHHIYWRQIQQARADIKNGLTVEMGPATTD